MTKRKISGRRKTTNRYYHQELYEFQNWLIQNNLDKQDITDFTPFQFRDYFNYLTQPRENGNKKQQRKGIVLGRTNGGKHASYRAIRVIFNWIWEQEDFSILNPISKVKIKPNRIPPLAEIPTENIQALLNQCHNSRYELRNKSILKVLFDSGLRATELCNLNIKDVNLETGQVTVWHDKGNKYRISWIGVSSLKTLHEYLSSRTDAKPSDSLFPNQENKRMTYSALRILLTRLSRLSNVPYQGVHSFRRAFALTLWRETHDLLTVSRLLGHSSIEISKRYLNVNNEDLREIHNQNSPADLLN